MSATVQNNNSDFARSLRVSITGECNLDCFYCKPLGRSRDLFTPKTLIQPSDVSKLVKIVGELGVHRVVIGGGEPLLRKDVPNFVKAAYAHKGISDVRMVTNGTYLKTYADGLRKMGLRKIDINFDSLRYERYQAMTKRDDLFRVLDGIEKIEKLNFLEIRLNIFLLKGVNEDEIIEFARITKDRKLHIRFIEYHPPHAAADDPYASRLGLSVLMAKRKIDDYQRLNQVHDLAQEVSIPTFQFTEAVGKISFLSQMETMAEEALPSVVFNADGVLYHSQFPNRPLPILADLRKDAKEARLHRAIEKVLWLKSTQEKSKPSKVQQLPVSAKAKAGRASSAASARR